MSGADKNDCADWCILPADHLGPCHSVYVVTVPMAREALKVWWSVDNLEEEMSDKINKKYNT